MTKPSQNRPIGGGASEPKATIDLYWLPLGAGGNFVRVIGRAYEWIASRIGNRPAYDLYHAALQIDVPEGTFVIEQAPIRNSHGAERGVVAQGAVGSRWIRRLPIFRYEIRVWPGGEIPDIGEAVDSPRQLSDDVDVARRLLETVKQIPTPVWGRDELNTGEMWNSNSVVAWILTRSQLDAASVLPPAGGRAPGWQGGILAAQRLNAQN